MAIIQNVTMIELSKWESEFAKAELAALTDSTYDSNFKAAILAPSVFLKKPEDFESCFDSIIYHLDTAIEKCHSDPEATKVIQHIAQILFHSHIDMIQKWIDYLIEENKRSFVDKIFGNKIEVPQFVMSAILYTSIQAKFGIELANLLLAYFKYLYESWRINKQMSFFYLKIAKVFRKIVSSKSYNPNIKYIKNVIDTNKTSIAYAFIETSEWDEAVEFLAYLEKYQPYHFKHTKKIIIDGYLNDYRYLNKVVKKYEFENRISKIKKSIK